MFLPLVLLLGLLHKPTAKKARLWLSRMTNRAHDAQMKWINSQETCNTCKGTRRVVRSSWDFSTNEKPHSGTTCWYEKCPDCICQVCDNKGMILKSQQDNIKLYQPCPACEKRTLIV